jgi:type IV secretory pathway VirB10-like protein
MMMDNYNNNSPASRHLTLSASGVALLGLLAATANSQTNESVIVDVGACVEIEDREQQLECYESRVNEMLRVREFERAAQGDAAAVEPAPVRAAEAAPAAPPAEAARTAPPAEAAPVRAAETAPAARREQAEEPELSRAERRTQRRAERQQLEAQEAAAAAAAAAAEAAEAAARAAESPSNITATVTDFREIEPDMLLVTLDNGQVWRQNRTRRYPLRVGATVVLRPSSWGSSYRMTDPSIGGFIQVERRR